VALLYPTYRRSPSQDTYGNPVRALVNFGGSVGGTFSSESSKFQLWWAPLITLCPRKLPWSDPQATSPGSRSNLGEYPSQPAQLSVNVVLGNTSSVPPPAAAPALWWRMWKTDGNLISGPPSASPKRRPRARCPVHRDHHRQRQPP